MRSLTFLKTTDKRMGAAAPLIQQVADSLPTTTQESTNGWYQGVNHNFGRIKVFSDTHPLAMPERSRPKLEIKNKVENGPQRKLRHFLNGKSNCSPTWFGDTSPEIDAQTGGFTGKLIVKYNHAVLKDPCVRECVELHESVHVQDLTPIVKRIHACDVAAGKDWDKKEKCNEMSNREFNGIVKKSECHAYNKSYTCLTLKILDSAKKCSKSPHREEIQKHRGYEACEMKKACAEAGSPEAGIPNT